MFFYCVPLHQCHGSSSFCCRSGSGSNFHFDPDQDPDPDTSSFTHVGNSEEIFSGNKYSIVKLYIWLKLIWIRQKDADPDPHYSCFDGQAGFCVPLQKCHRSSSFFCRSGSNFHFDADQDPDPDPTPSSTFGWNGYGESGKRMPIRMYIILVLTGRLEEVTAEEERQAEKVQETINQLSDRMEQLQAAKQDQATISFSRFSVVWAGFRTSFRTRSGFFFSYFLRLFHRKEVGGLKVVSVDIVVFHQYLFEVPSCTIAARIPSRKSLILISHWSSFFFSLEKMAKWGFLPCNFSPGSGCSNSN